jgi:S1-C subfamily serine protease
LAEKDEAVTVQNVLAKTPAAVAGLKKGDRIDQVQGKEVHSIADVRRLTAGILQGQTVRMTVGRGDEKKEITITAGEGL